jgi:hypothetical protein
MPILSLGRIGTQWLKSLHCLLWIGSLFWRLLGSSHRKDLFKMNIDMPSPFGMIGSEFWMPFDSV